MAFFCCCKTNIVWHLQRHADADSHGWINLTICITGWMDLQAFIDRTKTKKGSILISFKLFLKWETTTIHKISTYWRSVWSLHCSNFSYVRKHYKNNLFRNYKNNLTHTKSWVTGTIWLILSVHKILNQNQIYIKIS